jgi:DNA-binding response OmpR family regulator
MLEEHIWGTRYALESNIVEVTVSRLRKKMEDVGIYNFIITRHGLGYIVQERGLL